MERRDEVRRTEEGALLRMLHAYTLEAGALRPTDEDIEALASSGRLIWIDIVAPSGEELASLEKVFDVEFGSLEEIKNIEASARFQRRSDDELHLRADFLNEDVEGPDNSPVQFVVVKGLLLSVHHTDLPSFRLAREYYANGGRASDAKDVLLEIYATDAEYSADVLESIHHQLKGASRAVLTRQVTDKIAAAVLSRVAQQENMNGIVRHNISDNRRALSFLRRERLLSEEQADTARYIARDLDSLDAYTAFLFDKINFLMDATVGFINVSQNNVIKIFSVGAVAMLPPTLIASIYGMNFEHMPELDWLYGYPFALTLMAFSVAIPFWFFRRRGWLR